MHLFFPPSSPHHVFHNVFLALWVQRVMGLSVVLNLSKWGIRFKGRFPKMLCLRKTFWQINFCILWVTAAFDCNMEEQVEEFYCECEFYCTLCFQYHYADVRKIICFLPVAPHGGQRSRSGTEMNSCFAQGHHSIADGCSATDLSQKRHFFSHCPSFLESWWSQLQRPWYSEVGKYAEK